MSTLALVAGCSTAQRAEVRGVVRDRATGRVISGARVIGADGSLAETDANGRFRLYVHGAEADVRVRASGHSSEHVEIAGLEALVLLAPIEAWGGLDESAHVVSFVEETWSLDTSSLDGGVRADAAAGACPESSRAEARFTGSRAHCASCHQAEARAVRGARERDVIAPHDGLGGGCLACHGQSASRGDAASSCVRCHGVDADAQRNTLARAFDFVSTGDLASTSFEMRSTRPDRTVLTAWARALARDRSRGAHDPRPSIAIGRAIP